MNGTAAQNMASVHVQFFCGFVRVIDAPKPRNYVREKPDDDGAQQNVYKL